MVMSSNKEIIQLKKKRLEEYYIAESKILNSQSYTLGSKTLTRANLKDVQNMIKMLENEISTLEAYGTKKRRIRRVVPID